MIEEQFDLKDQAISLAHSPLRERYCKAMEVIPPSPSSHRGTKEGKSSSDATSKQDLGSKKSEIGFIGENLNMLNVQEESENYHLKEEVVPKRGKKIKKCVTLKKSTRRQPMVDVDRQEHSRTVDVGVQTKTKVKSNAKLDEKIEFLDFDIKEEIMSEISSKQRPNVYSIRTYEQKMQIVKCANAKGTHFAARKYHVSVNNIHRWRVSCKRRPGAGRKINDPDMQSDLINWIKSFQQKYGAIPQRKDVRDKAIQLSSVQGFQASKGWYQRFLDRNSQFRDLPRLRLKARQRKMQAQDSHSSSEIPSSSVPSNSLGSKSSKSVKSSSIYMVDQVKIEEQQNPNPNCIILKMRPNIIVSQPMQSEQGVRHN